jgi:hypothetical protein
MQVSYSDEKGTAILYRPTSNDLHENVWGTIFGSQAVEMGVSRCAFISWRQLA